MTPLDLNFNDISTITKQPMAKKTFDNGYTVSVLNQGHGWYNIAVFDLDGKYIPREHVKSPVGMDCDAEELQETLDNVEGWK